MSPFGLWVVQALICAIGGICLAVSGWLLGATQVTMQLTQEGCRDRMRAALFSSYIGLLTGAVILFMGLAVTL